MLSTEVSKTQPLTSDSLIGGPNQYTGSFITKWNVLCTKEGSKVRQTTWQYAEWTISGNLLFTQQSVKSLCFQTHIAFWI